MKANTKQHTVYKTSDGERLPGVTTVINELGWNKNMLIAWSRREALAGNDPDKIKNEAAKPGTLTHSFIEGHIKGEQVDTSDFTENQIELAKNSYFAFVEWERAMKPVYLGTEIQLVSEKYRFGGTADMIGEIGGTADYSILKGFPEIQLVDKHDPYRFQVRQMKVHHHSYESTDVANLYPGGYLAQGIGLVVFAMHGTTYPIAASILQKEGIL
mgnify:CR=1 FL=1